MWGDGTGSRETRRGQSPEDGLPEEFKGEKFGSIEYDNIYRDVRCSECRRR